MSELKNIVQIRQLLVTRTFMLTIQHTVADDLAIDTTYNIINPLIDSGNLLLNHTPENIIIKDVDTMFFWVSIGILLSSLYYVNIEDYINDNNENGYYRLKKFIPYNEIRYYTSFMVTLCVFLFTKNVLPAT